MRTPIIMLIMRLEIEADTISREIQLQEAGTILRETREAGTILRETLEIQDSIFLGTRNIHPRFLFLFSFGV